MTLSTLGSYRFEVNTAAFDDYSRSVAYRWKQQERLGREPAQQYMGKGSETISLKGTIYPSFKGGIGQLDAMRASAEKGEPLTYVDGLGTLFGKYCIKSVKETGTVFHKNGVPRKQTFDLSLVKYGSETVEGSASGYSGTPIVLSTTAIA